MPPAYLRGPPPLLPAPTYPPARALPGCTGKAAYRTQAMAQRALARLWRGTGKRGETYACRHCGALHVTTVGFIRAGEGG